MTTRLRQKMIRDLTLRGMADTTKKSYIRHVRGLARYYNCSPDLLTEDQIQDYLYYLVSHRNYADSTLRQTAFGLIFFYRVTLKWPETNLIIPTPNKAKKLPCVLSRKEVKKLFDCTPKPRDRALLMTAYSNGLRISEVINLKILDIDSSRMTIHVRNGKGKRDRLGGLSEHLLAELRDYWSVCKPKIWLFPGRKPGSHLTDVTAAQVFQKAVVRAGIKKRCTFHTLRHSFATHLLEGGKNLRDIQRLLGHRQIASTLIYIHLAQGSIFKMDSPLDLPPEPES